ALPLYDEAFRVAQRLNRAGVGTILNDANIRRSLGTGPVAETLRALQDAERERADLEGELMTLLSAGEPISSVRRQIDAFGPRLSELRAEIRQLAPDYAAYVSADAVGLNEAASLLAPDEALVFYATRPVRQPDGSSAQLGAAIVLTRNGFGTATVNVPGGLDALSQRVRCAAARTDPACARTASGVRGAFSLDGDDGDGGTPEEAFDYTASYEAFKALMEPLPLDLALDGIRSLVIVPDSALVAMPFHLMVTAPTAGNISVRDAPWLLRDVAITVTPTVSSFIGLRRDRARSRDAALPGRGSFLGIGDPLIGAQANGPLEFDCQSVLARPVLVADAGDLSPVQRGGVTNRNGLLDLAELPDTECELRATARSFSNQATILIHENAREATIKEMSADGRLADFSVISFATHGLIAGELGANQAGLVMTPPTEVGSIDDGLLTTDEIAALRLNADFVLLSACNTAAGEARDAEGLSGLAGAFFYAGARNLLVSHWPVYSDAATRLTTGLFDALADDPEISRADALRRSVLSILDDPKADPRQQHPAYWGPFMLVGEGGRP
ncbi:MAG: CHAT domain-containing protein, partial [Pseudomonadota bacterium]